MGESEVHFDAPFFRSTAERLREHLNEAFQAQLSAESLELQSQANSKVPVQSGELKASSFTDAGPTRAGNPAATIGYEDPKAPAVHEGFHRGKKLRTPNRFWLQEAANHFAQGFAARMAAVARSVVGG